MSNRDKINENITAIKRLQTFNPFKVLKGIRSIPKEAGAIRVKSQSLGNNKFVTTSISIKDKEALKKLDIGQLKKVNAEFAKAVQIAQKIDFDPEIVDEVDSYLPGGMVDMSLGGAEAATGINFNFNCKRLPNGKYWPTTLEEIRAIELNRVTLPVQDKLLVNRDISSRFNSF